MNLEPNTSIGRHKKNDKIIEGQPNISHRKLIKTLNKTIDEKRKTNSQL